MNFDFGLREILMVVVPIITFFSRRFLTRNPFKHSLTFILEKEIDLDGNFLIKFPDFKISFKDKPLKDDLKMVEFSFQNTGNVDLEAHMLKEDLVVRIPSHYCILDFSLISSSPKTGISVAMENNSLLFTWNLLKQNENFSVRCFLSSKSVLPITRLTDKDFFHEVSFDHRITNLKTIDRIYSVDFFEENKSVDTLRTEAIGDLFYSLLFLLMIPPIMELAVSLFSSHGPFKYFKWDTFNIISTIFYSIFFIIFIFSCSSKFKNANRLKRDLDLGITQRE